jgi:hypothetical protein
MASTTCPIWGTAATPIDVGRRDGIAVDSSRAGGEFFISRSANALLANLDDKRKALLTYWLVKQHRLGIARPEILSQSLEDLEGVSFPSVAERADGVLRYLASHSDLLGTVVMFRSPENASKPDSGNALMAWTASRKISEVITLAEYANSQKWVEHRVERPKTLDEISDTHELMLRPPGYARLAALDGSGAASDQAFVAMWFDECMSEAYEKGIATAIREAGYEPMRIDKKGHNNKIDDEIIAEIRRSRFVVADFSGARGGVYYEAGFAHGLNMPVIFTCHADEMSNLHFDTRQYNHIAWKSVDELKDQLSKRISATVGDGPKKKA